MLVTSVDMRIHRSWYITIQQTCGYIAYGCIREKRDVSEREYECTREGQRCIWEKIEMYLRVIKDLPKKEIL